MTDHRLLTRCWTVRARTYELGEHPWIMGIVNATPDSFSDGGLFADAAAAIDQALRLVEQGADVIDVGGESTRPGADPVSLDEELRRVCPVIEGLARRTGVLISIDTMKADVAREALAAGASIVNDVSALAFDPRMSQVCAETGCGIVAMHMQGTPRTMQHKPSYVDVVAEVSEYLQSRIAALSATGIDPHCIVLDPGIGFGKTAAHNLALLSHVGTLRDLGRPVLIGHSRKRFLASLLGKPIDERTSGTIGVAIALAAQHADIIRVHDVAAVKDALTAWRAVTRGEVAGT